MTGLELKIRIIKNGLTVKEFAEMLGMVRSRVSHAITSDIVFEKAEKLLDKIESEKKSNKS